MYLRRTNAIAFGAPPPERGRGRTSVEERNGFSGSRLVKKSSSWPRHEELCVFVE
jgi:hypothetical protein